MLKFTDPLVEIMMPSFLMPPLELRHADRVSDHIRDQMTRTTSQLVFPRRVVRLRLLKDVYVAEEGLVFNQDLAVEPCTVRGHDHTSIDRARKAILREKNAETLQRVEGDIVLCKSAGARNYGHWLVEMLPMAFTAARYWPRPTQFLLQRVDPPLADVIHEAYGRLGITPSMRVECDATPVLIDRLVVVEGLTDHGNYIAPLVMETLDELSAAIRPDISERLFVSRGTSPTRKLPRELAIARRLLSAGYVGLAPGSVSFAAQISAFKGAQKIIGVIGATMTNLVFSPRGSEAILISPSAMPDTFFWFICGLRGIRLIDMRFPTQRSEIGNLEWDGRLELSQQDEDDLLAVAIGNEAAPALARRNVNDFFDASFYRTKYGSQIPNDADPLEHFFESGWLKGFDPSPEFSTNFYLKNYPDVANAGVNPLTHYIHCGLVEGRLPKSEDLRRPIKR